MYTCSHFQLEMLTNADLEHDEDRLEILECIIENAEQNISWEVYQIFKEELISSLELFYKSRDTFS